MKMVMDKSWHITNWQKVECFPIWPPDFAKSVHFFADIKKISLNSERCIFQPFQQNVVMHLINSRVAKFKCPHVLDNQKMDDDSQKLRLGCPPDSHILTPTFSS